MPPDKEPTEKAPKNSLEVWDNYLSSGNYNDVMRKGDRVFKYQNTKISDKASTDNPQRSVRLFNQINNHLNITAEVLNNQLVKNPQTEKYTLKSGWSCPFIRGEQASDADISKELIKIFNRTRRIVMDAPGEKNFLSTDMGIVCIDVGMALELEATENQVVLDPQQKQQSIVSNRVWSQLKSTYTDYFKQHQKKYPETVTTLKALIFIREHSLMHDASCLQNNPDLIKQFAKAYDLQLEFPQHKSIKKAEDKLNRFRPATLENLRHSCINELERYINSRGSMKDNVFSPSLITQFFRNVILTRHKVAAANDLLKILKNSDSDNLNLVKDKIHELQGDAQIKNAGFKRQSGLDLCLKICSLIVETVPNEALVEKLPELPTP